MLHPLTCLALALSLGAPAFAAQAIPAGRPLPRPQDVQGELRPPLELGTTSPADIHRELHHEVDQDGGLWVRGKTYKSRVSPDGMTYLPFLGAEAPRNFPLTFRLAGLSVGDIQEPLTDAAKVRREGDRMTLDRGPAVARYDFDLASVEQSFAIETDGAGDVVLELEYTSDLVPARHDGGIRWSGPHGGVDYGAATALDHQGRSLPLATDLLEGHLRITVPGWFVSRAGGSFVVDPLLSTFDVDQISGFLTDPDIAYDAATDSYLAVYNERFSGGDLDVYAIRLDANGGAAIEAAYFDVTDDDVSLPKVANVGFQSTFACVATRVTAATGDSRIFARAVQVASSSGLTWGPEWTVAVSTTSGSVGRPDIGGDPYDSSSSAFFGVTFLRQFAGHSNLYFVRLDLDGRVADASLINLEVFSSVDTINHAISKTSGDPFDDGFWTVVWIEEYPANTFANVVCRRIAWNGSSTTSVEVIHNSTQSAGLFDIDVSDTIDARDPVTGDLYYLVQFDDADPGDDQARLLLRSGTQTHQATKLQDLEQRAGSGDVDSMRMAAHRDSWSIVSTESVAGGRSVFCSSVRPVGGRLAIGERRVEIASGFERDPAVASTWPATGLLDFFTIWEHFDGAQNRIEIDGARLVADVQPLAGSPICIGNPNSTGKRGFFRAWGDTSNTADKTFFVTDLPPFQFGFFLTSLNQDSVVGAGGSAGRLCLGGSIGRMTSQIGPATAQGTYSITFDPTNFEGASAFESAMVGERWYFQFWHRDTVGGAATSNFSNGIGILFE